MKRFFNNPISIVLILVMIYLALESGFLNDPVGWFTNIVFMIPGLLVGLTFHEYAHAKVAYMLGDNTPKVLGRVSLNPARHIDPIGLVALVLIGFGWGKPVQINPFNFKKPRRDEFLVSIAGVTLNFILAFIFTGITVILFSNNPQFFASSVWMNVYTILNSIVWINLVLMIFNLLPIPPLDGFNIVTAIFDLKKYKWWGPVYRFGMIALLLFIVLGLTSRILVPALTAVNEWMVSIFLLFV